MPLNRYADYKLRGADTHFRHLPTMSVFCTSAEHSENESNIEFPLLQTVRCTKKVGQVSILSITK